MNIVNNHHKENLPVYWFIGVVGFLCLLAFLM